MDPEVVEAPVEAPVEPVAEGAEVVSPKVPVEGTGEAVAEDPEGSVDLDPDVLDYVLRHAPPEKLAETEFVRERERAAEQRAETQLREKWAAQESTTTGTNQLIQLRQQMDGVLDQIEREIPYEFRDLERYMADGNEEKANETRQRIAQTLDPTYLKQVVAARDAGMFAELGLRQATEASNILADLGKGLINPQKPLTALEQAELHQAQYDDAQRGTLGLRSQRKVIEILMDRHGKSEFERGRQLGLKDEAAKATILDKTARIKAIQNGADPGKIPGGKPSGGIPTPAEYDKMTFEQRAALTDEVKDKIAQQT